MTDRMGESELSSRRVFLCHSSGDKKVVRQLYGWLRENEVDPWLDEEDILPGQDWEHEIEKAVRQSAIVIVCLSSNSVAKTGYVNKEIKYALDVADQHPEDQIFIIPVRIEECPVPDRLKRWQWVDIFEPAGYDRLLRALKARGLINAAITVSSRLRLSVHRAFFLNSGIECFFINATNIGTQSDLEITHIWFATDPPVHVFRRERPLPKRLRPQETWETWVRVNELEPTPEQQIFTLARARLSTGDVVKSIPNKNVPDFGIVPGGSASRG